jgi:hypothetical protein
MTVLHVFGNFLRGTIAAIAFLSIAQVVAAQSITDARRVEFTPSPDHNAVDTTSGVQLVTNYTLNVYLAGSATPVQTANLGKPTPDTDGMIRLDFVALLTAALTPGLVYESVVSAVGPGGVAASARSNTFGFTAACAPTISPASRSLTTSAGATGTVTVTAAAGCMWTAASNASWITISAGTSGNGNGSLSYSVTANSTTSSRTGTLTIAGRTFTVTQAAAPCTFTISPTGQTIAGTGASITVTVTTSTGCAWSATNSASWITINSGANGNGSGSVRLTALSNPTSLTRTATLTIAGHSFVVTEPPAIPTAPSNLRIVK